MSWQQVIIDTQLDLVQAISAELEIQGALAITFKDAADEPIFEPDPKHERLWSNVKIIALFNSHDDIAQKIEQIQTALALTHVLRYHLEILPDQDWERNWMKDFHPMQFGANLWICPSWCEPPNPKAINIMLDPGLAFGTGTHATTALCLEWLSTQNLQNKTVVDYGCGSGILAIACSKLNAREIWAVDHCDQALEATEQNALHNELDMSTLHIVSPEHFTATHADLIIANILASPLIELASKFIQLCAPGTEILLSGILASQTEDILQAYQPHFEFEPAFEREEWICLHGKFVYARAT